MTFKFANKIATMGHSVLVIVTREGNERLMRVETTFDGSILSVDSLSPTHVHYERSFEQVGSHGPGMQHTVVVNVVDFDGNVQSATRTWNDTI